MDSNKSLIYFALRFPHGRPVNRSKRITLNLAAPQDTMLGKISASILVVTPRTVSTMQTFRVGSASFMKLQRPCRAIIYSFMYSFNPQSGQQYSAAPSLSSILVAEGKASRQTLFSPHY